MAKPAKQSKPQDSPESRTEERPDESCVDRAESAGQAEGSVQDACPPDQAETAAAQPAGGEVNEELEALRNEVETLRDKHLRALADYQNLQKRAASQQAEAVRYAQAELVKALLVVLDDFERTLEAARSAADISALTEGVRIIYEHMLKILGGFGVEQILVGKGDLFDPMYQEAVAQQPSSEVPEGHVLQPVQVGYKMGERVLRPVKVVVAAAPAEPPQPSDDSAEPPEKDENTPEPHGGNEAAPEKV